MPNLKNENVFVGRLVASKQGDAAAPLWIAMVLASDVHPKVKADASDSSSQRPPTNTLAEAWVIAGETFELRWTNNVTKARPLKGGGKAAVQGWVVVATGPSSDPEARVVMSRPRPTAPSGTVVDLRVDWTRVQATETKRALGFLTSKQPASPVNAGIPAAEKVLVNTLLQKLKVAVNAPSTHADLKLRLRMASTHPSAASGIGLRRVQNQWRVVGEQAVNPVIDKAVTLAVTPAANVPTAAGWRIEHDSEANRVRVHNNTSALTLSNMVTRPEEGGMLAAYELRTARIRLSQLTASTTEHDDG